MCVGKEGQKGGAWFERKRVPKGVTLRRCGLVGGSLSLGLSFEVSKLSPNLESLFLSLSPPNRQGPLVFCHPCPLDLCSCLRVANGKANIWLDCLLGSCYGVSLCADLSRTSSLRYACCCSVVLLSRAGLQSGACDLWLP